MAEAEPECRPSERKSLRRYRIELLASAAAYVGLLLISVANVDRIAIGPIKTAIAILPMIGVMGMAFAMVRYAIRADEFERQKLFLSGAIAAIVAGVVSMLLGFLENAGMPRVDILFTWPLIVGVFGIVLFILRRRYN